LGAKLAAPGIIAKVLARFRFSRSKTKAIILKGGVLMNFGIWSVAHNKSCNGAFGWTAISVASPHSCPFTQRYESKVV